MSHASSGGIANWRGASFELRLTVDYCVSALLDEDAALGPGAITTVQLQAPAHAEPVDDLIVCFESGDKWAVQAKAGSSAGVSFNPNRPFGKALRQLYSGATGAQIDLAFASQDRLMLAVDHQAPASVTAFGEWLTKARSHTNWQGFARAGQVNADERRFLEELPPFLDAPPGDELLRFLHHCWIRRTPPPDQWEEELRQRLMMASVPGPETARAILAVLVNEVQGGAPYSAGHSPASLRRACQKAGISDLPRAPGRAFQLFEEFTEDSLYRALDMPPLRVDRFVERPELAPALASDQSVLIAGRPGIGKSHALIRLALTQPDRPVVVVARTFGPDDISRLTGRLRRMCRPYQLIWDNIHEHPRLFAQAIERLGAQGEPVRLLAAYREYAEADVRKQITPDLCRRSGLPAEPLRLHPFEAGQAAEMTDAVAHALNLAMDEEARRQWVRHIEKADGGPYFAISTGKLLGQKSGGRVRAGDVGGLPDDLLDIWRWLYRGLGEVPQGFHMQSVLHCAHFLHRVGCPLNARLMELLATQVEGMSRAEYLGAGEQLRRAGWLIATGRRTPRTT
jgi:hypothetical protein